jgi:hypothetical protein
LGWGHVKILSLFREEDNLIAVCFGCDKWIQAPIFSFTKIMARGHLDPRKGSKHVSNQTFTPFDVF